MARIAIIGTGNMATGLGTGWARAGNEVVFGSRDPLAASVKLAGVPGAKFAREAAALAGAEVVVLAIPYPSVAAFAQANATALRGKVVIDISNPFDHLPDNRLAGAEITARAIGEGARVVAAFKANFAGTLLKPTLEQEGRKVQRDALFAGDDGPAKAVVAGLIGALGMRPVDCGSLHNARIIDGMVSLIIEVDGRVAGGKHQSVWNLVG